MKKKEQILCAIEFFALCLSFIFPAHSAEIKLAWDTNGEANIAGYKLYYKNGTDSFIFRANDGTTDSEISNLHITITLVNDSPVADAGADQSVNEGETVSLNGTSSMDLEGNNLSCPWRQHSGPIVSLSNAASANPSFVAPR